MELNSIHSGHSITHHLHDGVKCGICWKHLGREARIYKEGLSFGIVCETCYKNNSPEDLELMAQMFHAFGGYFGMIEDPEFSLYTLLKPLTSVAKSKDRISIRTMHQALLHGVTPYQFNQGLKILLED